MKTRTRFERLTIAIDAWLKKSDVDRQIMTILVAEHAKQLGFTQLLASEGITFNEGGNPSDNIRANAQKFFRWLGYSQENKAKPGYLFALEHIIVAAMPEQIRLDYLNDVYGIAGVTAVSKLPATNNDGLAANDISAALTKEHAEAQISIIKMSSDPSLTQAKKAKRELSEAIAMGQCALSAIEEKFSDLGNYK